MLTCAFLLAATFSFAGESNQTVTEAEAAACIPATLSCGIEGIACGDTLEDIIDIVLIADDILC
ncbi:hypothetical protein C8N46_102363 [Kordia periserrulae]|uniref:Uncharacterized protein n=2 Tax=Kordia periserrulae TaxID=701523 RepID=A0A2T6C3S1_9FLAO|nr:hypothetical protein C8N46_102363 [Kordia periserrulae]